MIPIIWQENIKNGNTINYVGSLERYLNIIEYYVNPFDKTKHIFHINLSFYAGTFIEGRRLLNLLFKQFVIDICNIPIQKLKPLEPSIRLENKSICGYVNNIEIFRAYKDIIPNQWICKILPICISVDSIEEGKKIMEEKLNLAMESILREFIKINQL